MVKDEENERPGRWHQNGAKVTRDTNLLGVHLKLYFFYTTTIKVTTAVTTRKDEEKLITCKVAHHLSQLSKM